MPSARWSGMISILTDEWTDWAKAADGAATALNRKPATSATRMGIEPCRSAHSGGREPAYNMAASAGSNDHRRKLREAPGSGRLGLRHVGGDGIHQRRRQTIIRFKPEFLEA